MLSLSDWRENRDICSYAPASLECHEIRSSLESDLSSFAAISVPVNLTAPGHRCRNSISMLLKR